MKTSSILIVEDETPQMEDLKRRARQAGFGFVHACLSEADAIAAWDREGGFNALLLDLNLGSNENEGYRLLRYLRSHRNSPERVFIRSVHLKVKMFSLEAVALHRITFYFKDEDEHESRLDQDLQEFAANCGSDGRLAVSP